MSSLVTTVYNTVFGCEWPVSVTELCGFHNGRNDTSARFRLTFKRLASFTFCPLGTSHHAKGKPTPQGGELRPLATRPAVVSKVSADAARGKAGSISPAQTVTSE